MFSRCAVVVLGLLLAACATRGPAVVAVSPAFEAPYTLDAGDRLRVVVFGQPGLSNSYSVDASGKIAIPLIGLVDARGCTTAELQKNIQARLRQGFMRDPNVAVEVETYRPFFILGEVVQSGQYPYVANLSVETAVAIAGGYSPRAIKTSATISRNIEGQVVTATVPSTYPVRPGDTINIQERWF
jgi:polysaccharide export outer membrane protein